MAYMGDRFNGFVGVVRSAVGWRSARLNMVGATMLCDGPITDGTAADGIGCALNIGCNAMHSVPLSCPLSFPLLFHLALMALHSIANK
jgi:hypothetical protein